MEREIGSNSNPEKMPATNESNLSKFTGSLLSSLYDDSLLNDCYRRLSEGNVPQVMAELTSGLNELLQDSSEPEWNGFVQFCMVHPLRKLLHEDPFTRRAYEKPRGYPGDPALLDFLYGTERGRGAPEGTSELGYQIFDYTTRTQVCDGVRAQARMIARTVDRLATDSNQPQVLSVMAGHLREADFSETLKSHRVGQWLAFDSDVDSLKEVRRCHGEWGVETIAGTVRQIVTGKLTLGEFDLIYSMGLYNYLEQDVGRRLTERLFAQLRPGGQLLISGFLAGVPERGYMESYMDWRLNYRTTDQLLDLAAEIDPDHVLEVRVSAVDPDARAHLGILQIRKA